MLGFTREEYLERVKRYNVVNDYTTPTTTSHVRDRVKTLLNSYRECYEPRFLVLGRSAASAFPPKYRYQPFGYPLGDLMIIPHPSGRNRFYNSLDNKLFIEQSLRDFLGRI
jgi:hypothetical protein